MNTEQSVYVKVSCQFLWSDLLIIYYFHQIGSNTFSHLLFIYVSRELQSKSFVGFSVVREAFKLETKK